MPQKIVAGNWKMNTCLEAGVKLISEIKKGKLNPDVDVLVFPPYTHLLEVGKVVANTKIGLGAQNCANHKLGAYTGEISVEMIRSTSATYVLVGHSERRSHYNETNAILKEKIDLVLENKMKPIYCCGETLPEREKGIHFDTVKQQIVEGLFHLDEVEFEKIILAYEPVWAIGTGVTATPAQAQEMHSFIRQVISEKYDSDIANRTSILYGGSCKPSNAKELFSQKDVNGGLIGGASLKSEEFLKIINAF